jgi:hypothetical protein
MADARAHDEPSVRSVESSFSALYAVFDSPRVARRVLVALLLVHSSLLAYSAYVHSPVRDEPGHLVAGLSHWEFGRFDLYRNNPPLVRMIAALPVMAACYEADWSGYYERPGATPIFGMDHDFVAANGERTFFLMMIARWACIPFSWIGAIACFLWARDLYGRPAGLLAAAIWCFEPNILAHASLITSDAAGTALGLAACYTFWRWLQQPTWERAVRSGIVLGVAELTKMTLLVFFLLWPLMWVLYRWLEWKSMVGRDWRREAGMIALLLGVGLVVLNLGYGFEGSLQPLKEFQFVSNRLSGRESNSDNPQSGNRFTGTLLGELPVPFPRHYVLGLDQQQNHFEYWNKPAYMRGQWSDTGWWYYYLYAALVKVPLALWLLGVLTLVGRAVGINPAPLRGRVTLGAFRDELLLLIPGLSLFVFVSSQTEINEHFRYVLPAFPYFFIWASQGARVFRPNVGAVA